MAHLPRRAHGQASASQPWARCRHRPWARTSDMASVAMMFAAIPSLPRAELARLTEQIIDRMDQLDGDNDLELNGDELDGFLGEDDFHYQGFNFTGAPDCPLR